MRRNLNPRSHGGPLVTDHLQLRDIDLELELLKRKREMIEQQQQMLNTNDPFGRPRPFEYDNNQPQQSYQPFDQGYDRYYQPQSGGYGGSLLGKRSMNDQPWESHSTPKRFSGASGGFKRKFNSGPSPKPKPEPWAQRPYPSSKPISQKQWKAPQPSNVPKSNFPSQRFNKPKPAKAPQRDFKPTKVTKAKPAASGNKVAPLPTAERAKQARQPVKPKDGEDPNFILQSDKVPSQQLAGRLELALGSILKEIKTKYSDGEHGVSFQSLFLQRQMKQAIRERLRSVMMGQYVGKVGDIVDSYRKVFPVDTDAEIVQIAAEAQQSNEVKQLAIKLEHAGTVYKYIKHNLNRLVGVTLDDMFEKLVKLYESDNKNTKDICREILAEEVPELKKEEGSGETESKEDTNVQDSAEDGPKEEAAPTAETANEEVAEKEETPNEGAAENVPNEDTENKEQTEDNDNSAGNETTETTERKVEILKHDEAPHKLDGLVLSLLKRRLPYILPKYKNLMMKVLNASGAYMVTKTAILEKAQQKQNIDRRVEEARQGKADKSITGDVSIDSPSANTHNRNQILPYLVKIFGRPALPKRKIMQTYLNDFKPGSVKKHRSMSLLFVAFSDKENYEKILAVKETTIGGCTIIIKASEKPAPKPDESLDATSTSLDTTVPSDLDNQIDELLLSIRSEEEIKEEETKEEEGASADAAENGDANNADMESNAVEESNEETAPELNGNAKEPVEDQAPEEANDKVEALKNEAKESGRATPTRASTRLSNVTPSSIRTRRASRLAN